MCRLNRRAQAIVEYVVIVAVAAAACIALYYHLQFAVQRKIAIVGAER